MQAGTLALPATDGTSATDGTKAIFFLTNPKLLGTHANESDVDHPVI